MILNTDNYFEKVIKILCSSAFKKVFKIRVIEYLKSVRLLLPNYFTGLLIVSIHNLCIQKWSQKCISMYSSIEEKPFF